MYKYESLGFTRNNELIYRIHINASYTAQNAHTLLSHTIMHSCLIKLWKNYIRHNMHINMIDIIEVKVWRSDFPQRTCLWKEITDTEILRSQLLRHEDLGVTNNTQVYLGDPIPTILMKVQENETLKDAIGRFKTMYPKHPSGRPFEVDPENHGDFEHVTPDQYILHDLFVKVKN